MTDFISPLDVGLIERGHADELGSELFKIWLSQHGVMPRGNSPIVELMNHIVMLDTVKTQQDSPDILFVGDCSFLASLIPSTISEINEKNPREMIDQRYRSSVREGYSKASAGEPSYELIRTNYQLPEGLTRITHERIILPFTSIKGVRWLFCHSIPKEMKVLDTERGLGYRMPRSSSPSNQGLLLQGRLPKLYQGGRVQIHT